MKIRNSLKIITLIIFISILVTISAITYRVFNPLENNESLNLSLFEKRWIEENKNTMIDIAILNNLPVFGDSGKGIFFSFLEELKKETALDFNKVSYNINTELPARNYRFRLIRSNESIAENNLTFYEDNYVVLSKKNSRLNNINNLDNETIGILVNDAAVVTEYLMNNSISYVPAENINILFELFNSDEINYAIIPFNMHLNQIIEKEYNVAYRFNDLFIRYVLMLDSQEERLNSIIEKYYAVWMNNFFDSVYTDEKLRLYYQIKGVNQEARALFTGKVYTYGFIDNIPYEIAINNTFGGINKKLLNSFAEFAKIELSYKKYKSLSGLNSAINNGDVDIAFNYYDIQNLKSDILATTAPICSNYVVIVHNTNDVGIDSIRGLNNKTVYTLSDLKLTSYLNENTTANIKEYEQLDKIPINSQALMVLDYNTYNFYKNNILKDYMIIYQNKIDSDYNFIIYNNQENQLFYNVFQFYLNNINYNYYRNLGLNNLSLGLNIINLSFLWLYVILIPVLLVVILIVLSKRKKIIKLKKHSASKYIDPLTSLKNRYYLNTHIEKWEENKIYPQAVIMIDLNNLKEINDSHGHDEGDKVIKAAANVLINTQIEKTDIIRTDGNEFMIYMVGYDEAQVVNYIRKLNRAFKDLPYEEGAAIGYSMIIDEIKLIDDAINEAVLDMITNKENKKSNEN